MVIKSKSNKTMLGFFKKKSSYKIKWKIGIDGGGIIYMPYIPYIFTDAKADKIEIKEKMKEFGFDYDKRINGCGWG
jgi:hypothetical protein